MNPLVSIVIPVYNVENVLYRCLDSVKSQSYDQLDIVLVDDGSTDNSGKICDNYAAQDNRISVLHIPNGGVSKARNVGIQKARGEYVLFVDSDDEITIDYVCSFMNIDVDKHKCLIIQGCVNNLDGNISYYRCPNRYYDKVDFHKCIADGELYKHGSPWGKLYSLNIIRFNNIVFRPEFTNYEDLIFLLDYIQYMDSIKYSPYTGYVYHITSFGLHLKYASYKEECKLVKSFMEKMKPYMLESRCDKISAYALYLLFRPLKSLYLKASKNNIIAIKNIVNEFAPLLSYPTIYLSSFQKATLFCIKRKWFRIIDIIYRLRFYGNV